MLRAADLVDSLGQENNPEWKTVAINSNGEMVAPNGSIGFRWGEKGKWNLEQRDGTTGAETELQLSLLGSQDEIADVGFPYFGGEGSEYFNHVALDNVLLHKLPAKTSATGRWFYRTGHHRLRSDHGELWSGTRPER
ncbi:respiratory nitrate reductase 1 subunit alpha [Salmonella enterica subsp. enterica]|uniref:Respiratory nitrate reductase 1 subunit alpha n=1 Tax=Salmonella enterica I TaxID=59201 RepID=A0A379UQF5_SALET|nr:respiratory nitrate reductase 1 subunit alpha [Salmonella enterica subsp. enterica]